jgi:hypothetical protein
MVELYDCSVSDVRFFVPYTHEGQEETAWQWCVQHSYGGADPAQRRIYGLTYTRETGLHEAVVGEQRRRFRRVVVPGGTQASHGHLS